MTQTSPKPTITSRVQPLIEYLKKQQENEKFAKSVENIATITLITFFLVFAVRPTALTISALVGEIKSKEILQKQMRQKINNVIQAQDTFSQVQERYSVINSSLPDSPNYTKITYQLQVMAAKLGFNIDQISFDISQPTSTNPLAYYGIKVNSLVPFSSTSSFLEQIGHLRRLITLGKVTISSPQAEIDKTTSPDSTSSDAINLNISSQVYYWQD